MEWKESSHGPDPFLCLYDRDQTGYGHRALGVLKRSLRDPSKMSDKHVGRATKTRTSSLESIQARRGVGQESPRVGGVH